MSFPLMYGSTTVQPAQTFANKSVTWFVIFFFYFFFLTQKICWQVIKLKGILTKTDFNFKGLVK